VFYCLDRFANCLAGLASLASIAGLAIVLVDMPVSQIVLRVVFQVLQFILLDDNDSCEV
jgi:hypothetical protein